MAPPELGFHEHHAPRHSVEACLASLLQRGSIGVEHTIEVGGHGVVDVEAVEAQVQTMDWF